MREFNGAAPGAGMTIREIRVKSIIVKSGLPDSDYVVNPYRGCGNGCMYCYARFMSRFTGCTDDWGTYMDAKVNAPELVPGHTSRYRGKSIFLSSVTDPYGPAEEKYRLTRRILEKLIPLEPVLAILTKSSLVLRDLDLIARFADREIGMTVTTLDDTLRSGIEPDASPVADRMHALREIRKHGIRNFVFISPILPGLTDWKAIIRECRDFTDSFWFENLNIKGTVWRHVNEWLSANRPDLVAEYRRIYFEKSDYWQRVEEEIRNYCMSNGIDHKIYFHHKRKR
jgi:DNA repair photolyase